MLVPLLAGSLERSLNLAEAMEARGYGRPGATRALHAPWGVAERAALAGSVLIVAIGALWL
jgi:energy-coupling factor transport system permease protein